MMLFLSHLSPRNDMERAHMVFVAIFAFAGAAYAGMTDPSTPSCAACVERVAAVDSTTQKSAAQARTRVGLAVSVLPPEQRKALGIEFGLRVEAVDPATDITGKINAGDVVVAVNDDKFATVDQFNALVARHKPGDTVALLVLRGADRLYIPVKVLAK